MCIENLVHREMEAGIMGEHITFKSDGSITPGYLVRPVRPGPGIIVIREWWRRRELQA